MSARVFVIVVLFLTTLSANIFAQEPEFKVDKRKEVIIDSWKKGTDTFQTQQLRFDLALKHVDFQREVISRSGKRFVLKFFHSPYSRSLDVEHWEILMFEKTEKKPRNRRYFNLFSSNPYGTFEQEEYIGIFYPEEEPIVFGPNYEGKWGFGSGFYYFKTARKINIEG